MEALGQKLKQARLARKITLEEASRITKIRPSRIQEIEQDDFSSFASLAYAKGFILIYGKFLDVDVTPYLDAFETSDRVTVDGYSYLQDNSPSAPPPIVRRQPTRRPAFFPFLIALAVLVIGLWAVKLFLNIQRIAPASASATPSSALIPASTTPTPSTAPALSPSPNEPVAPRAVPVTAPPVSEAGVAPAASAVAASAAPSEPEVRRAEPVRAGEIAAGNAAAPNEIASGINRVQVTPLRKTFVTVVIDGDSAHPAFNGWIAPGDTPLTFRANQVTVKTLDKSSVTVMKNGAPVAAGDTGVTVE